MDTINIIVDIVGIIAYAFMCYFVIYCYIKSRQRDRAIGSLMAAVNKVIALLLSSQLRENLMTVQSMKQQLSVLAENENFEAAERLQAIIKHAEEESQKLANHLNELGASVEVFKMDGINPDSND